MKKIKTNILFDIREEQFKKENSCKFVTHYGTGEQCEIRLKDNAEIFDCDFDNCQEKEATFIKSLERMPFFRRLIARVWWRLFGPIVIRRAKCKQK